MKKSFVRSLTMATMLSVSFPWLAGATPVQNSDLTIDLDSFQVLHHEPHPGDNILIQKQNSLHAIGQAYASVPAVAPLPIGIPASTGASSQGTQTVFLDFDSATTGSYSRSWKENADGTGVTITRDFAEHIYTAAERNDIKNAMQKDYGQFDISITTEKPTNGDYSTLFFNANMPGEGNGVVAGVRIADGGFISGILWGAADNIDFRNLDRNDTANLDANFWTVISDGGFNHFTGLAPSAENKALAIIRQSGTTGSHELGHDLGLRHHEAWGPIGQGLPTTGVPEDYKFIPVYTGPREADETTEHIMVSGASGGSSLGGSVTQDRYFGIRAATKLAFNEEGRVVQESDGPVIELQNLNVPNTLEGGIYENARLNIAAISIEGRLSELNQVDTYFFDGIVGDIFNFELISFVNSNNLDFIDGIIAIFDMDNNLLAWNDDDFEGVDSFLFDFILNFSGRFMVQVSAYNFLHPIDTVDQNFGIGNYQLFVTRTHIPEPAAWGLMLFGLIAGMRAVNRRKSIM